MRTVTPRLQEMGRIRIGDQADAKNGNRRPRKLTTFRFTSTNKLALDQLAALYGGEVERWEDAPTTGVWQVYSQANTINVILPHLDSYKESYEVWSGGGCQVACDGQYVLRSESPTLKVGAACACPDDQEMQRQGLDLDDKEARCPLVSRLSVILPGVFGFGVWRLESHGYYAAAETKGIVAQLRAMGITQPLPCCLRLEERERKKIVQGKPQTRKFAVPVLTPQYDYTKLLEMAAQTQRRLPEAPPTPDEVMQRGADALADLYGMAAPVVPEVEKVVISDKPVADSILDDIYGILSRRGFATDAIRLHLERAAAALGFATVAEVSARQLESWRTALHHQAKDRERAVPMDPEPVAVITAPDPMVPEETEDDGPPF